MSRVQGLDWAALSPVVAVLAALVIVLVVDALAPERAGLRRVHDAIAVLGLLASGGAIWWLATEGGAARSTLCVPALPGAGGAVPYPESCSFVVSPLTLTLQALVAGTALVCLLLAVDGAGAADRTPHHVLLLAAVGGAMALAGARDLASFVVALETASLPAIGLVALRRDARGAQAGVTLLLTAVASLGLVLLGTALVLLATGSLHLSRITAVLARPELPVQAEAVAVLGVLLVAAGVGFKLSAVPFHLWTPDTYAGAPMPIAAFLSVVSKAAGATAIVVLLVVGFGGLAGSWAPVVGVVAGLTVTVGNLVALRQTVAVRLLAWSTVAQAGWVLLPLAGAAAATQEALRSAASASVGYLTAYAVAGLAAFAVVVVVSRHHPTGEEHTLDAYRGLARRKPVTALVLGFALLCLAGLPPGVVGLVAKVLAVRPLVDAGAWALAAVAAVNVALGIAYYLRWTALLVMRPVTETGAEVEAEAGAGAVAGAGAGAGGVAVAGVGGVAGAVAVAVGESEAGPGGGLPGGWRLTGAEWLALTVSSSACVALSVAPQAIAGLLPGTLH